MTEGETPKFLSFRVAEIIRAVEILKEGCS